MFLRTLVLRAVLILSMSFSKHPGIFFTLIHLTKNLIFHVSSCGHLLGPSRATKSHQSIGTPTLVQHANELGSSIIPGSSWCYELWLVLVSNQA